MHCILRRVPVLRYYRLKYCRRARKAKKDLAWQDTQSVLMALGNITISWAGINLILNSFFEKYQLDGGPLIRKDLPRSFALKLDYMKKIEKDHRWAPGPLSYFRAARLRLGEMNEYRIGLVHGLLLKRGYTTSWTIHMAKEDEDRLKRWNVSQTSQDIHDFSKELGHMVGALAQLLPPSLPTKG